MTDWSGLLTFPQFNPSLGTLTEVDLTLSGGLSTTLTITNNSDSPSTGNADTLVKVFAQDVGNNLASPAVDLFSPSYNYSLPGGDSIGSGLLTNTGGAYDAYTNPTILGEFTGYSTLSLTASTFTETQLSNTGGNTDASQVTDASFTGTVTYQYTPTPTPEPSTLALLGVGSVGLLGYGWRRRAAFRTFRR